MIKFPWANVLEPTIVSANVLEHTIVSANVLEHTIVSALEIIPRIEQCRALEHFLSTPSHLKTLEFNIAKAKFCEN